MKCPARAEYGDHEHHCARTLAEISGHHFSHLGPHVCPTCIKQWDEAGVRVAPGNNPYKEKEK